MASNGNSDTSAAPNGGRRLPEGSLPDSAPAAVSTQNPKMSRKRTKTGCLTCRKRRIKCGEERPICSNCVKSKRNCEGYNQRVVFKDPMNAYRPSGTAAHHAPGSGTSFDQVGMPGGPVSQYARNHAASVNSQAPLPAIAPRPSCQDGQNGLDGLPATATYSNVPDYPFGYDPTQLTPPYPPGDLPPKLGQVYETRYALGNPSQPTPEDEAVGRAFPTDISNSLLRQNNHPNEPSNSSSQQTDPLPSGIWPVPTGQYNAINPLYVASLQTQPDQSRQAGNQVTAADATNGSLYQAKYGQRPYDPQRIPTQRSSVAGDEWILVNPENKPLDYSAQSVLQRSLENGWLVNNGPSTNIPAANGHPPNNGHKPNSVPQEYYLDQKATYDAKTNIPYQQLYAVEDPEDDYYDVDSDGDPEYSTNQEVHRSADHRTDLSLMLALSGNYEDGRLRSFTAFLNEPHVLATYRPTATASPLMDPQTARVFCHFVTSTGPSLSIFERHPTNPSVMFTGAPVPAAQQALWTYTLPTLALNNQGLLHAMLALASLHIAKLQHTSPTPSLKHYHYALRRVARAVGLPARRQEIATFAATLLLGFYEVMTAEHSKWNSHLAGAKQLAMEIDFAGMTKRIKATSAEADLNRKSQYYGNLQGSAYVQPRNSQKGLEDAMFDPSREIDENLVSTIMGSRIRYGELGHVVENYGFLSSGARPLTSKDLEDYRIQCDLFWWYCKQDVYQSIISGNCLLMPYDRWGHCPPRAPIGRLDAIYGTMDHLILLMGRIGEFGGKDQIRKREVVKANGGVWRPRPEMFPPGMFPGPPPGAPHPAPNDAPGGPPSMQFSNLPAHSQNTGPSPQFAPPMYGMVPSLESSQRVPDAFIQGPHVSQNGTTESSAIELETATAEAEAEWNDIKHAFDVFEQNLGADFQPLSPEYMQPLSTPFGPALYYRTYSIACIWALYYTGRIIAARVHPSMPPAAMVAAGIAAFQTKEWAKLVGRVCAGLQPTSLTTELNPSLGAALIGSSLGLFFAGIQYQDAGQRGWTITKLRDIARLTGWQSSAAIASGCETAWTKAAEAGKGPPYQRTMDPTAKDDRVAGRRPDLNGGPPKDNNDRRFITINPSTRLHWALGLLSVEEDMRKLSLDT